MIIENVKIPIKNSPNTTFNDRERTINVEIQKIIDAYSKIGLTVVDREIVTKTATHANVKFTLQQMFRAR
jgi:hypothetical protein